MAPKALVTGGNRGIGREIATGLIAKGYRVVVGVRCAKDGPPTATALGCDWVSLDVANAESRKAAMEHLGGVDILVNNAGVFENASMLAAPTALSNAVSVMLDGPVDLIRLGMPHFKETEWGRIVNVSSSMGSFASGLSGPGAYGVVKAAMNAMTVVLAREMPAGVTINAMDPGWVHSRMGGKDAPRTIEQGADTAIWLATMPDGGPNGGFFRDCKVMEW